MNLHSKKSYILSKTLDLIGFSKDMITFRQETVSDVVSSCNRLSKRLGKEIIWAGSKAEGLRVILENDTDKMNVPMDVLCTENPASFRNGQVDLLHLRMEDRPPGYTLLQPYSLEFNYQNTVVNESLVETFPRQVYLSSDVLKTTIRRSLKKFLLMVNCQHVQVAHGEHGPSITTLRHNFYSVDEVFALACECPTYKNSYLERSRSYQWPSAEVLEDISNLKFHVVPVGYINSSLNHLEWRICFTQGETRLMKSLNDCLTKVIVLLKEIANENLKPLCKEMSTYVMKNIVLWVAELTDSDKLTDTNLIPTLLFSLQFLKQCLIANKLPSYIMPERNLLADRVSSSEKLTICTRIDSLLKEGPKIILHSRKIKSALVLLYRSPDEFLVYYERLKTIETLVLLALSYSGRALHEPPTIDNIIRNSIALMDNPDLMGLIRSIISSVPRESGTEWMYTDMGPANVGNINKAIDFLNNQGLTEFRNMPSISYLTK